ncbi:MAG: DNA-directed polymerase, partial [Firmicutes bacterium]|nr:DNA-directed polymerase [Bacillota bacterium]
ALSIMDECMELAAQIKQNDNSQQISLFGDSSELLIEEPRSKVKGEMDSRELLSREKEVLGFYVSENPLDRYRDIIPLIISEELGDLEKDNHEGYVRVAGLASELSKKVSRKGEPYARFVLEDLSGRMEMMIFPSAYQKTIHQIEPDQLLIVEGFIDRRDETQKISVRNIGVPGKVLKDIHIRLPYEKADDEGRRELVDKLAQYPGDIEVVLHLPNKKVMVMTERYNVASSLQLKKELTSLYGKGSIWYS